MMESLLPPLPAGDDDEGPILILLRHGESEYNASGRFCGWHDAPLTPAGEREASAAGARLAAANILPDVVHTSLLSRSIHSANLVLAACGRDWVPVRRSWRLNERHYGSLTGQRRTEVVAKEGIDRVRFWRRAWEGRPPPMPEGHTHNPQHQDVRYMSLPSELIPRSECLCDVTQRLLPYYFDVICKDLREGRQQQPRLTVATVPYGQNKTPVVFVVAHSSTCRALIMHLQRTPPDQAHTVEVPNGIPVVFHLHSDTLTPKGLPRLLK